MINSDPDAIKPIGLIERTEHIYSHSGISPIFSGYISTPILDAKAISCIPFARPPSVKSCIAWTSTVLHAIFASLIMLMPGENSKLAACLMTWSEIPAEWSAFEDSRARIAVPSIAILLVNNIESPSWAPEE